MKPKRFVLDCSVSAAWCLKDESSRDADIILDALADGEAVVPALWIVEMTNVLVVAERRRRIGTSDASLALELLESLPIVIDQEAVQSMPRLYELARTLKVAAYDATYLDLARRRRLPLASLDKKQRAAAKSARIRLL